MTECSECDGTGIVEGPMNQRTGPNPPKIPCPACMEKCGFCHGSGEVTGWLDGWQGEAECEHCNGRGYVPVHVGDDQ